MGLKKCYFWVFWHNYENWPNSNKDSSITKRQIIKKKLILECPYLLLSKKIKKFILDIHRTSYGHLKVWSKIAKFDPSGSDTQNLHKIVKFNPKLYLLSLFCRKIITKLDFKLRFMHLILNFIFLDRNYDFSTGHF